MKKGIIFDMDGTLWDSAAGVAESWNEAMRRIGYDRTPLTAKDIQSVMGKTMEEIADILFPDPDKELQEKVSNLCYQLENDYLRKHGGVLYSNIRETMERLKATYHLYIVSNCQKGYIEAFLDHYHFWDYFSDIECYGNNLLQKGDNIRLLADRNHLEEAVYVGDIQGDYEASKKAGVGFIHAAYGFGSVPEAQNDMIFSIICEELGIFGGIFVLILFGYLLYRLFFIAQNAPDLFGSLIVTGIFIHIALQVILNIAVVLNLMPNTGVTLPFISYGGTSILFLMLEMAIALSVARQIKFQE